MKRGAPENPKVKHLAELLNIEIFSAVGILEMLWHFTARYAPQGDIGRYGDKAISEAVGWRVRSGSKGVATEVRLTSALVHAGFLDRCETHRLLVHDWAEHADQSVARYLTRRKLDFVKPKTSLPEPVASSLSPTSQKPHAAPAALVVAWDRFLAEFPSPTDVDLGCQQWLSLASTGVITEQNLPEIFAGLERWKTSKQWATRGMRHSVATWLGYSKNGTPAGRRWLDHPEQAIEAGGY